MLFFLLSYTLSYSQTEKKTLLEGSVTFVSSQYVYVKYENTEGIEEGDTLFTRAQDRYSPALIVKFISSSSTACYKIIEKDFLLNEKLFAFVKIVNDETNTGETLEPLVDVSDELPVVEGEQNINEPVQSPGTRISGRFSSQSYSNFSNYSDQGNYQRWRHSVRFSAENIEGSGLSFSTYSIFAYKADDWSRVTNDIGDALKVYDLTVGYDFNEFTRLRLGRYLNRKISNISSVDGVQFEKVFPFVTLGIVGGSRPDFTNFGYNFKLFEYGIYFNRSDSLGKGRMENTFSVFEQTNDFKTDRRFIYLQHTNNIVANTSLFFSSEIDLYKKIFDNAENSATLTSVFISARYTPIKEISFSASYDARKNVIYYETFKSFIDSVFENETRQGMRFRTNIRPFRNLSIGLNYGYRFRKSDPNPNSNYGGYINYSSIPLVGFSSTFSFNRLNSSYLNGNIAGISFSKSIDVAKSDVSLGLRYTEYKLLPDRGKYSEKSMFFDVSSRILHPVFVTIGYEGIFEMERTSGRILMNISLRF
jgi:hypothetical protein